MNDKIKQEVIRTRCTKSEKEAMKIIAKSLGISISKLILNSVIYRDEIANINTDGFIQDNNYKTLKEIPKSIDKINNTKIINELRRLGGLQKHLFNQGFQNLDTKLPKEYYEILQEIKAAIKRIGNE